MREFDITSLFGDALQEKMMLLLGLCQGAIDLGGGTDFLMRYWRS
jgi:hypothetical protein